MDRAAVGGARSASSVATVSATPERVALRLLSVVIPTFNRARFLARSIPLLLDQQLAAGLDFEIIFVDNGSSDETPSVLAAASAAHGPRLRHYSIPASGGPATPRNVGIRAAQGEVVVMIDDDILPEPGLFQAHADYHCRFPELHAAAVGEAFVPPALAHDPLSVFHDFDYRPIGGGAPVSFVYFWTCNVSAKRDFLLAVGGFDERFLYNEDIVLGYRLHERGMQLRYCADARGAHWHQLKAEHVRAKAEHVGRWIWATITMFPVPEIVDRYGVLAWSLGARRYLRRLLRRAAFRLLDTAPCHVVLRMAGADAGARNRASDLQQYLSFRRAVVAGYRDAQRMDALARRQGRALEPWQVVRNDRGAALQEQCAEADTAP